MSKKPEPKGLSARQVQEELEALLPLLNSGNSRAAIPRLQALVRSGVPSAAVLYNLGIALSNNNRPQEAIVKLKGCLDLEPNNANAWVGMGVAQSNLTHAADARVSFERALKIDPDNSYALRNLGAILMFAKEPEEAKTRLERANRLQPGDPKTILGLGLVYRDIARKTDDANDFKRSELYFKEVIALAPESESAEAARESLTDIAHNTFNKRKSGFPRPDVMMYIMGALRRFKGQSKQEITKVAFEIAMLGRSGFDINTTERTYRLASLPGMDLTGLHMVSIMYTGFRLTDGPYKELGVDFSDEFEAAMQLEGNKGASPSPPGEPQS